MSLHDHVKPRTSRRAFSASRGPFAVPLKPPIAKDELDQPTMNPEATPRITAPYLESFANQGAVRILGKVLELRGDRATIDAGGHITILLNRVSSLRAFRTLMALLERRIVMCWWKGLQGRR